MVSLPVAAERIDGPAVPRPADEVRLLAGDAALYGLYAVFAGLLLVGGTSIFTYRMWAQVAAPAYVLGALLSLAVAAVPALRISRWTVAAVTAAGAHVLPLGVLVGSGASGQALALHPEVLAVQRAAERLAAGEFPYLVGTAAEPLTSWDFTPYLPAMFVFGLPRALFGAGPVTDARLAFVVVGGLAATAAVLLAGRVSVRAVQVAALGPLVALPFCSGGHDLAVVGVTLLGLALLVRERSAAGGAVLGLTAAMKITAVVPVALMVIMFVARGERGAAARFAAAALGAVTAVVLPFALVDGPALWANVVLHPAGLEPARLIAATPFPGVLLADSGLWGGRAAVALLLGAAVIALGWVLRRPPRDLPAAMLAAAWCLLAAILTAPSSRAGYLVYPLVLAVAAHQWRPAPAAVPSDGKAQVVIARAPAPRAGRGRPAPQDGA